MKLVYAAVGVFGAALLSTTAALAQVPLPNGANATNVVTFGDSLSDAGNFKAQNPGAPVGVPYMGPPLNLSRFTNGPTWAELLAAGTPGGATSLWGTGPTALGNLNYAFGSARSDAVPALIGGFPAGPGNPFFPTIPGLPTQIAAFTGAGGTFGPNTLVTVWAGANDVFQAGAGYPNPAAAAIAPVTAAQNVGAALATLLGAGARNIVVNNLPNLGTTPDSIAGGPAAQAVATAATNAYNATLVQAVRQVGAGAPAGSTIILADVNKMFAAVTANPAQFGLANVTQGCVLTPACAGNPAAWNTYAFWDGVHPTAAGHRLIAATVADYLAVGFAGRAYAAFANLGQSIRNDATEATALRLLNIGARQRLLGLGSVGETEISLAIDGNVTTANGARLNQGSVRLMIDRSFIPGTRLGVALAYTFGSMSVPNVVSGNGGTFSMDLYGGFGLPSGFFGYANAGFGVNSLADLRRPTLVPGITNTANADGLSSSAAGALGWAFRVAPRVLLSPIVSLGVGSTRLNAFQEMPTPAAQVSFGGITNTRIGANAQLRLDAALTDAITAYASVGYTHVLSNQWSTLRLGFADNPSIIAPQRLVTASDHQVTLGAGVSGALTQNATLTFDYRGGVPTRGGGSTHIGRAMLSVRF